MTPNLDEFIRVLDGQCEWASIRYYEENTHNISVKNSRPYDYYGQFDRGIMVEVLQHGQIAYAATQNISVEGVQSAFRKAIELTKVMQTHSLTQLDTSVREVHQGQYAGFESHHFPKLSISEIQSLLIKLTKQMQIDPKIVDAFAWVVPVETKIDYISTSGAHWTQTFLTLTRDLIATAQNGHEYQKRSLGMQARQWGLSALDYDELSTHAARISRQAIELLDAPDCPTETTNVILMPDQLYLQIHESIGHPLEIDRILGDERNYAGWSFVGPDDFGQLKYGSDLLNVVFEPQVNQEMASYLFDDHGTKAERKFIIENGKLMRGLGGKESQKRSSIPGVACARACSWNRPPMDRMANINIATGESSFSDLIESVDSGIIMHTNRSWSIDDYRNKFQFGCEYAQEFKNGQLGTIYKNPNYRGISSEFWKNLIGVGDESTNEIWGSPFCGKGEPNQVIRVGHATPACLFKNIEVFGGA
jgi:predicted Zn-dependent protease